MTTTRLLSPEEELALLRRAQTGDLAARNTLIECNLGFVRKLIHDLKFVDFDDYFQEGVFGLAQAIEHFDCDSGNRFTTYAWYWIRAHLFRMRLKQRLVRPAYRLAEIGISARKYRARYRKEHGREPTLDELAKVLKTSQKRLVAGEQALTVRNVSLDAPNAVHPAARDTHRAVEAHLDLERLTARLTPTQRQLITWRLEGRRVKEIAALLGVPVWRVDVMLHKTAVALKIKQKDLT